MTLCQQTYLWVLNREKDFERAYQLGAAGVMSDRIQLLRNFLDKENPRLTSQCDVDKKA